MDRKRPDGGWRAASFAAALFAITLNFLQPLAHAALMRDGGLADWASMCLPGAGPGDEGSTPATGKLHECCLGLAHAPALVVPSASFVIVELPHVVVDRLSADNDVLASIDIRDGPHQPRAPPSLV